MRITTIGILAFSLMGCDGRYSVLKNPFSTNHSDRSLAMVVSANDLGNRFAISTSVSTERSGLISSFGGSVIVPSFGSAPDGSLRAVYLAPLDANTDGTLRSVGAFNVNDPTPVWTIAMKNIGAVASLDWDQDGVPDALVIEKIDTLTSVTCINSDGAEDGTAPAPSTQLHLLSGATGAVLYSSGALPDFCFKNNYTGGGTLSFLPQWSLSSLIANNVEKSFAISPLYATQSWIFHRNSDATITSNTLYYPSTSAFETYTNAQYLVGQSQKWGAHSHLFNGLIVNGQLDFFTSNRFLAYLNQPLSPSQLAFDLPFEPGGINKGDGRFYGVVAKDPSSSLIAQIGGCTVNTVLDDNRAGAVTNDLNCGIRREVAMIDTASQTVRGSGFYSYLHDGGVNAQAYVNRVTFPSNPIIRWPGGGPASIIYNSYVDGSWYIHVSVPGGTDDLWRVKDHIVWDVIDIDQDGVDEILFSPTRPTSGIAYFPAQRTVIAHITSAGITNIKEMDGYLPVLAPSPKRDTVSSSDAVLFSAVRALNKPASLYFTDTQNHQVALEFASSTSTGQNGSGSSRGSPSATTTSTYHWITISDDPIACQYMSEAGVGSQMSGACSNEGQTNTYEWGTGISGGCNSPTFLRNRVIQRCVKD